MLVRLLQSTCYRVHQSSWASTATNSKGSSLTQKKIPPPGKLRTGLSDGVTRKELLLSLSLRMAWRGVLQQVCVALFAVFPNGEAASWKIGDTNAPTERACLRRIAAPRTRMPRGLGVRVGGGDA